MSKFDELTNQELFSIAAGLIVNRLYDSFPCSVRLDRDDILQKIFSVEKLDTAHREVSHAQNLREMSKMEEVRKTYLESGEVTQEHLEKVDQKRDQQVSTAESRLEELQNRKERIETVYSETADFLSDEGLIRETDNGYRLSGKGFAALGYEFKDLGIEKSENSSIALIKEGIKSSTVSAIGEGVRSLLTVIFQITGF